MVPINFTSLYSCTPSTGLKEWFISISQYLFLYIQLLLIYVAVVYITGGLSAWDMPSESATWGERHKEVPTGSPIHPQISFDFSMKRDSGGLEDRSNPSTINLRVAQTWIAPASSIGIDVALDYWDKRVISEWTYIIIILYI